ncbi:MAG TPA: methyltransferase domain-containing protein [Pyrinomonadaceae bacterium]|nr:methyltransferase domain-containing protein [Pyrinomonadaceae bacterium]
MSERYFETRFTDDPRREILWQTLVSHYFQPQIPAESCVLELGAGYANFINNVRAARRVAQDQWPELSRFVAPGVESHIGPVTDLSFLTDSSVDFAFASNLFEHVSQNDFASVLAQLRRKLKPQGNLTLVQPNYRYAYREYFDDYTHITPYSHLSICDFLQANSYEVVRCVPRFLPLTLKSRLKVSPLLIRLYLLSPFKPLGKQMLVQARPNREAN